MQKNPRLCFVGNMLGRNAGHITTQGQIMADLFSAAGYETACVSSKLNRAARLAEISAALIKNYRRFDLVLLEVYSGLSVITADLASLLCKTLKIPLIMVLRGGNLPEFMAKRPDWTTRIFKRADCLVAPSAFLAEKIGAYGFEIKVIPNIVELKSYPFKEREKLSPRLIWMRSFHPVYHPEMAIEAIAELRKDYPAAKLIMAGADKGLEAKVKKMVSELDLSEAVSFPGFLTPEKKLALFSEADIYLNTNRIDNMPVSVVEACAYGLPVVATDVGGVPYLLTDRENGLLVENENVGEMVGAIKLLLEDAVLAHKISRRGRQLAERSAWSSVRAEWEKLFAEILEQKASRKSVQFAPADLSTEKQKS